MEEPSAGPGGGRGGKRNKLPRKSISFSKPQDAWLAEESRRLGISESEIVRHSVDVLRGARPHGPAARHSLRHREAKQGNDVPPPAPAAAPPA